MSRVSFPLILLGAIRWLALINQGSQQPMRTFSRMLTISSHRRKVSGWKSCKLRGTRAKYVALAPKSMIKSQGCWAICPHIIASGLVNQAGRFQQAPQSATTCSRRFRDITPHRFFRSSHVDRSYWVIIRNFCSWSMSGKNKWRPWLTGCREKDERRSFGSLNPRRNTGSIAGWSKWCDPGILWSIHRCTGSSGVVAEVTGLLSEYQLSLINLKILETRETSLVFTDFIQNANDLLQAEQLIQTRRPIRVEKIGGWDETKKKQHI